MQLTEQKKRNILQAINNVVAGMNSMQIMGGQAEHFAELKAVLAVIFRDLSEIEGAAEDDGQH